MNNYNLIGLDPFLENHKMTNIRRQIEIPLSDSNGIERKIIVQPYVLPFQKDLSREDEEKSGGIDNYKSKQGFYIYRNERLIVWGTWFGRKRSEMTKYSRYITLDQKLMNYIGNPDAEYPFLKRGLIIGDVQSGKTSTYIGFMCKAADDTEYVQGEIKLYNE